MNKLEQSSLYQLTSVRFRLILREPEAIFWIFIFPILLAEISGPRRGVARAGLRGPQAARSLAPIHAAASTQPSKHRLAPPRRRRRSQFCNRLTTRSRACRCHDRSVTNSIVPAPPAG